MDVIYYSVEIFGFDFFFDGIFWLKNRSIYRYNKKEEFRQFIFQEKNSGR